MLSTEAAAEPGRWQTDRAPYQREPMDACGDPAIERVVLMWASQTGKTELLLNLIGYVADLAPGPMMMVQPTIEMAEAYSKDRVAPMIRDTPRLTHLFGDPTSRNSGNTLRHKALGLDTPLPTVEGWTKMAEVRVGDTLFDERGHPTQVTGLSPVFHDRPCYRVTFSDGTAIVADAEHLWHVEWWRVVKRPAPARQVRESGTLTTAELLAAGVRKGAPPIRDSGGRPAGTPRSRPPRGPLSARSLAG